MAKNAKTTPAPLTGEGENPAPATPDNGAAPATESGEGDSGTGENPAPDNGGPAAPDSTPDNGGEGDDNGGEGEDDDDNGGPVNASDYPPTREADAEGFMTIRLPASVAVSVSDGNRNTIATINMDLSRIPDSSLVAIMDFGLRQKIANAYSGRKVGGVGKMRRDGKMVNATITADDITGLANAAARKVYTGETGTRGPAGDPVSRKAADMAEKMVRAAVKSGMSIPAGKPGHIPGKMGDYKDLIAARVKELAARPDIVAAARAEVERERATLASVAGFTLKL